MPQPTLPDLEALSRSTLFRGVSPNVIASFVGRGSVRDFPANAEIWREGDASDGQAYVIVGGAVTVSIEGKPVVDLGPGDIFGEYALVSEGPRSATVRTKAACHCVSFGKEAVGDLLAQDGSSLSELIIRRVKENSSAHRGAFCDDLYMDENNK